MKTAKQAKALDKNSGSIWFLILGVSLITLYFNTNAYDPFNTPKFLILLVLCGWLSGHIVEYLVNKRFEIKSKEFLVLAVPLFFIFSQIFGLIFTDIFIVGLIGETQRRNGALSYSALALVLIFCSIKVNLNYAIRIIKSSIYVGLVLCVYGLMQTTGNDFVNWNNPNNAMIATVGNPNFASSLLALMALISFFSLLIQSFSRYYKIMAFLVLVLSVGLIIESQSRQGLLVMGFAIIFYLAIFSFFNLVRFRVLFFSLSITLVALSILGMLQIGPLASILYKDSLSVRGYYWRAALKMFESSPIYGVGIDRYDSYFKEFREPGYALRYGFDITSNNAHNVFLQLFSTGGLVLGFSYLAILTLILIIGAKSVKYSSGDTQKFNLLILSSWIGFQSQSLISIDNLGISIWGWVLGGTILGMYLNSQGEKIEENKSKKTIVNRSGIKILQPLISAVISIPILFCAYNLQKFESDTFFARAYTDPRIPQNSTVVYDYAQKVVKNPFADPYYKFIVSLYMVDMGLIEDGHREILILHKKDPRNLNFLAWLVEYEKITDNLLNQANYREQIARLDPWNALNYFELGKIYLKQGDLSNSSKMKAKILSFAPYTEIAQQAKQELP